jgi:hypothetical protein
MKTMSEVNERYRNAYQVSRNIKSMGTAVKVLGFVFGAVILALIITYMQSSEGRGISDAVGFAGLFVVVAIPVSGWITGNLISAQSHMLMAVLDTAVNTSPSLSLEGKVQVIERLGCAQIN